jgi:hypothetical protein
LAATWTGYPPGHRAEERPMTWIWIVVVIVVLLILGAVGVAGMRK